jgi:hypothetical protein
MRMVGAAWSGARLKIAAHTFAGVAAALLAIGAFAHTLDEIIQNSYLTLAPGEIRLELEIVPGHAVAAGLAQSIDADGDWQLSEVEAYAFARAALEESTLSLNGQALTWDIREIGAAPYELLADGHGTLRLVAVALVPEREGRHTLNYRNTFEPAASVRSIDIFLEPREGWTYEVLHQERREGGRELSVVYTTARE